ASAVSRTVTRALSCRRRGLQGREPLPPASSPPLPLIPAVLRLTGLGQVRFSSQAQPKPSQAQLPQSSPAFFRAISPSGGPVRSDQ
ncbi:hypothetical protein CRG98_049590, partial [Punica granatum]